LAGYYKWFIRNFSKIGYPIRYVQRKEKKFEWTGECENSIDRLKELFTNNRADLDCLWRLR
ncbi:MAG: hypothetical protein NWP84_01045, partial [Cyanobium sp. MAG_04]|nr:hypothetical protein [Cyanobium sp. MAG_04]